MAFKLRILELMKENCPVMADAEEPLPPEMMMTGESVFSQVKRGAEVSLNVEDATVILQTFFRTECKREEFRLRR